MPSHQQQRTGTLFHTSPWLTAAWQVARLSEKTRFPCRPGTRDVGLHGHQNVGTEKFWINKIWKNSPSGKPICCWWLPVPGNGPDSSCRPCSYPRKWETKRKHRQESNQSRSTNAQSRYYKNKTLCNRNFLEVRFLVPSSPVINFPFFCLWMLTDIQQIEDRGRRSRETSTWPRLLSVWKAHAIVRCLFGFNIWPSVKLNTAAVTAQWVPVLIIEPEGERLLTVAKMAVAMHRPMANGADPLTSLRFSSQTPKTTSTRVNVEKNSTPNPCVGVRALCTSVTPSVLWNSLGVKALFQKQKIIKDIHHVNRKRNIIRSHLHHQKFGRSVGWRRRKKKTWPEHLHTGGLASNKVKERHKRRWALRWWSCAHAAAIPARPRDIIPSSRQQTGEKKADFFFLFFFPSFLFLVWIHNYLEKSSSTYGAQTLGYYVEDGLDDGDFAGHEAGHRHGRVEVATANVSQGLIFFFRRKIRNWID